MRGSWVLAALLLVQPALAQTRWVGSWATSQQVPEPRNALAPHDLDDATLRPTVHLSLGGEALRLKLSNAFGTAPLHVAAVHNCPADGTRQQRHPCRQDAGGECRAAGRPAGLAPA